MHDIFIVDSWAKKGTNYRASRLYGLRCVFNVVEGEYTTQPVCPLLSFCPSVCQPGHSWSDYKCFDYRPTRGYMDVDVVRTVQEIEGFFVGRTHIMKKSMAMCTHATARTPSGLQTLIPYTYPSESVREPSVWASLRTQGNNTMFKRMSDLV